MSTAFGTTTAISITSALERRAEKPLRKNLPDCSNSGALFGPNYDQFQEPLSPISIGEDCGTISVASDARPCLPRTMMQVGEPCSSTPRS